MGEQLSAEQIIAKREYWRGHILKQYKKAEEEGSDFVLERYLERTKQDFDDSVRKSLESELKVEGVKDLTGGEEVRVPVISAATERAPEQRKERPQREVRYVIDDDRSGKPAVFGVETQEGEERSYYKPGVRIPDGIIGTDKESKYLELLNEVDKTLRRQIDREKKVVHFSYTVQREEQEGSIDIPKELQEAVPLFLTSKRGGVLAREEEETLRLFKKWYLNKVRDEAMNAAATEAFSEKAPSAPEAAEVETGGEQKEVWKNELEELRQEIEERYNELKSYPGFEPEEKIYKGKTWQQLAEVIDKSVEEGIENEASFDVAKARLIDIFETFNGSLLQIEDREREKAERAAKVIKKKEEKKQLAGAEEAVAAGPPVVETRGSEVESVEARAQAQPPVVVETPEERVKEMNELRRAFTRAEENVKKATGLAGRFRNFFNTNTIKDSLRIEIERHIEKFNGGKELQELSSDISGKDAPEQFLQKRLEELKELYRKKVAEHGLGALEERTALLAEQNLAKAAREKGIPEAIVTRMYKSWHWLGEKNLTRDDDRGFSRFWRRAVSARTGIAVILGVGSIATGTVPLLVLTRLMRGTGMAIATYDILRASAEAKEKTKGLLQKVDKEKLASASEEEILKRMAAFELHAEQTGKNLAEMEDYKILQELLEVKSQAAQARDYLDKQFAKLEKEKSSQRFKGKAQKVRHAAEAILLGGLVGSGSVADAYHNAKQWLLGGETPVMAPIVPENATIEGKGRVFSEMQPKPSVLPTELQGADSIGGVKAESLSQEKIKELIGQATIRKGEGVTHALERQLHDRVLADPQKYGFAGNVHNEKVLHRFLQHKAAEIAEENGYIKHFGDRVEEIRVRNVGVKYFLTDDNHVISTADHIKDEYDWVRPSKSVLIEHPQAPSSELKLEPIARHADIRPSELSHLAPEELKQYHQAEKGLQKIVDAFHFDKNDVLGIRPVKDAASGIFDGKDGVVTLNALGDLVDVKIAGGKIVDFTDPINHSYIPITETLKDGHALQDYIFKASYKNWADKIGEALKIGHFKLAKIEWLNEESARTLLGSDSQGIMKITGPDGLKLDVHIKDGNLWKIGEKTFLDKNEMISVRQTDFPQKLVRIVERRIPVRPAV